MVQVKWTTKVPTTPGWYFAYEALDILDADVLLVHVAQDGEMWAGMTQPDFHVVLDKFVTDPASQFSHYAEFEWPTPPLR